ncbi:MAG: 50S ribosomal protein L23 [Mycoplasmataceae bacterium]|jgi:large subunit ribosomal protein L23|nr:50S ribosomal protein L23 [Mycoplasmataceae bacterium]
MEFTRIILYPLHTEKTYTFGSLPLKKYAFVVDVKATKHDIGIAFESIYGIHPTKIATQIRKPARVRTGTAKPGFSKLMKIAYITLPAGSDIAASNKELPKETATKEAVKETTPVKKSETTKKEITKKEVVKKAATDEAKTKSSKPKETK